MTSTLYNKPTKQDGEYSWLILSASFVGLLIEGGLRACLGVYVPVVIEEFHSTKANALGLFAIANALAFLFGMGINSLLSVLMQDHLYQHVSYCTA